MAEARRQPLYDLIGTIFSKHEPFTGQEPPNEYLDRIWNSISHLEPNMTALENANALDFDDAIKCGLLKTKLGGKYIPVPTNNPYTNPVTSINTSVTLRAWMNIKYQRKNIAFNNQQFKEYPKKDFYQQIHQILIKKEFSHYY